MPVLVTCPACQRKSRIPDVARGKMVKCPSCGNTFTATGGEEMPNQHPSESVDTAELATPIDDARRVEQMGAGLLTISQGVFAFSMALQLLNTMLSIMAADIGPKASFLSSFQQIVGIVAVLAGLIGAIAALVGSVFGLVSPAFLPARAAAASVLALTLLVIARETIGSIHNLTSPGNKILLFPPAAFEAARQALLAVYARLQARRLGDAAAAAMATFVAVAYPVAVMGVVTLVVLVNMFSAPPHQSFDRLVSIVEMLAQTVLVAWSAFLLWRVWTRLRSA